MRNKTTQPAIVRIHRPELTPEERETIAKTGRLYVLVMGTGVPPLSLSAESMLEKEGES